MKRTIFLLAILGLFGFAPVEEKVDIIVNKQNTITGLSLSEVRIYWMRRPKKRWEAIDKTVKPVDYKGNSTSKKAFYNHVLRLSETDVESYFTAKQYQSGDLPPSKFTNEREVIDYVGNEIGSIGFVTHGTLTEEDLKKVKIVFTVNNN